MSSSVLDTYTVGKNARGITLTAITNGAGTSNTILLAHKALQPRNYGKPAGTVTPNGLASNDQGWVWTSWPNPSPDCCWCTRTTALE